MNNLNITTLNKTMLLAMVLFFISTLNIYAQQRIAGIVVDESTNNPIPYVTILIKNISNLSLLSHTTTDENGNYSIELTEETDSIRIEASIISHFPKSESLLIVRDTKKYTLNFSLKERVNELNEINIKTAKRPITVVKDTVFYEVNAFKDGSERVVEDLLKKLPGISIETNGVIKFKGKQVTRILLDGDNIFDNNYTIGTKNIDSEIVESIQAIEDYNQNPLLKGVKSSDDVAVNLILKKGKTDVSGSAELGVGADSKKFLKANGISVSKKLKGFSTLSYNNIGENNSPFNFLSNNLELSFSNERDQRTNNLVNSSGFNSVLPDNRVSVNDNFVGSINSLYKANKNLSFRTNYNFFKDKLKRNESNSINYELDEENFNILNEENISKRPLINAFDYELIYKINTKSLLTSVGKFDSKTVKQSSSGFNNGIHFENFTKSSDVLIKNETEYTYKINSSRVIQLSTSVSSNNIPQLVNVTYDSIQFNQDIDFRKNYFKVQSSLLNKTEKSEFAFDLGYNVIENYVNSDLQGLEVGNQYLTNDLYFKSARAFFNTKFQYRFNKWKIVPELNVNHYNVKLIDANLQTKFSDVFFNLQPKLYISYSLNKNAHFYTNYYLSNQLPTVDNIYSGLILINNRSLSNNDFDFNLFDNHLGSIGYRINDFYNLFQLNIHMDYGFKKFGYIQRLNIDESFVFSTNIVDATNNNRFNFGLELEKYVHSLKSTFNLNSSYSILEYQNIVNDSGLRQNKSKTLFGQFNVRTGFKGDLNFENEIFISNNSFSNSSNSTNSFTSFQNHFKAKYLMNRFQFIIYSQYFKPDLQQQIEGDLFLDASLSFKTKNGRIEYFLKANNLLNKKVYQNINSTDFSTSVFEHNLQERFLLLSVQFKF